MATWLRWRRATTVALVAGAGCFGAVAVAAVPASAALTPVQELGTANSSGRPSVLARPDGSADLAWTDAGGRVLVATKRPGEAFAKATRIASGSTPTLLEVPGGRVALAWIAEDGRDARIAFREPGAASFGLPATVATAAAGGPGLQRVALASASDGRVFAAAAGTSVATMRSVAPAGSVPEATARAQIGVDAPDGYITGLTIAVAEDGRAHLVVTKREGPRERRADAVTGVYAQELVGEPVAQLGADADSGQVATREAWTEIAAPVVVPGAPLHLIWSEDLRADAPNERVVASYLTRHDKPLNTYQALAFGRVGDESSPGSPTVSTQPPVVSTDATGASILLWGVQSAGSSAKVEVQARRVDGTWIGGPARTFIAPPLPAGATMLATAAAPAGVGVARLAVAADRAVVASRATAEGAAVPGSEEQLEQARAGEAPDALRYGVATADRDERDFVTAWAVYDRALPSTGVPGDDAPTRLRIRLTDDTPPTLDVSATSPPAAGTPGTVRLHAVATDAWTGATATWSFEDGSTANGPDVERAFPVPGRHVATATARDGAGNTTTRAVTIDVPRAPVITPTPAPPTIVAPVRPVVSGARLSRTRFAAIGTWSWARRGAIASYTLSAPAPRVEFVVRREVAGVLSAGRCRPKARGRRGRPCTSSSPVGLAGAGAGAAGANRFRLAGTVGGRRLAPGTYVLVIAASPEERTQPRPDQVVRFRVRR